MKNVIKGLFLVLTITIISVSIGIYSVYSTRVQGSDSMETLLSREFSGSGEVVSDERQLDIDLYSQDLIEELPEKINRVQGTYLNVVAPLMQENYYSGKYENAAAGVDELNNIPALRAGEGISIIGDGYITLLAENGYVDTGHTFASGVCWTVSVYGYLMDEVNERFELEYGMPLFVQFERYPHSKKYATYGDINSGNGYAIFINDAGWSMDYSFMINPEVENIPEFEGASFKINMTASDSSPLAYQGQEIGAELVIGNL